MKAAESLRMRGFVSAMTVMAMIVSMIAISADRADAVAPGSHGNGIVTDDSPVGWTPHVLDGYVRSFADLGNIVVAAGNFSEVTNPNGSTQLDRDNVFAFQKGTGVIQSFSPNVNGEIYAVLPTGEPNMIWMIGGFTSVNGQNHSRIVKINVSNEQIDNSFDPPNFDGRIHDIALRGDRLYVMGRFLNVGGQPHTLLAALDPDTGDLIPEVDIEFSVPRPNRPDGFLTIVSGDVTPDGTKMVVIGNFTVIDGQPRYQIGVLDLTTDPISLADWRTTDFDDSCAGVFETYMRDVEISPDGEFFVVATTGAFSGGWWFGTLCDSASRWDFSRTGNNLHPEWIQYTGGDTLTATAVTESLVYLGGHQRWHNNPFSGDSEGPGAVDREGLAAADIRSGAPLSWNPGRDRGVGVYGFLATDQGLWIGSDTDRIARYKYRGRIAFMPLSSGSTMPADWTGSLPGTVYSTGDGNSNDLVRRDFDGDDVTLSQTTTGSIDLTDVKGAFMVDDKLYMAFDDNGSRSFEVMTFDGDFGPQEGIDLNGLDTNPLGVNVANFENFDIPNMHGMFYDSVMGRLYFTSPVNGTSPARLSWRQFSPESNIVGAVRENGPTSLAGLNWDDVRSMFLVGSDLYVATANGNLTRWDWNSAGGTPVAGTNVVVSGPGIDGEDWSANGAFLLVDGTPPNVPPTAIGDASCVDAECDFDGSGSFDPDGTVVSWDWDFDDGDSDSGEMVSHTYTDSGTYDVSLTVTDDDGDTDTHEFEVEVTVPALDPVASFTVDCGLLECDFDGSGSFDPDGTVVSWDWDFDDGDSDSGEMVSHTFGSAGTYSVSLTVTDNDGGTDTFTDDVTVFDSAGATVVFHASNEADRNTRTPGVNIPANSQVGDVLVLIATINNNDVGVTGPPGWTLLDSDSNGGIQTYAWTKVVGAGEPGTQVELTLSERKKSTLHIAAYGNASAVADFAVDVDSVSGTQRTTPTVTATNGSALVSYWADKSSNNVDGWTLPGGVTDRGQAVGQGGGRIASALGETDQLSAGTVGGLTATTDSSNDRQGAAWSIIIAPG